MTNFFRDKGKGQGGKGNASLREAREKGKGERGKIYKSFPFLLSPLTFPLSPNPNDQSKILLALDSPTRSIW
jgi:hypothetical protein